MDRYYDAFVDSTEKLLSGQVCKYKYIFVCVCVCVCVCVPVCVCVCV
jgi:hypothetical protein